MTEVASRKHLTIPELVFVRRAERMAKIDNMPDDWRALVHEYGLCVVNALRESGIVKARNAKHIVETVLDELSPTRGSSSRQGAAHSGRLVTIPCEPTESMIAASLATVSTFDEKITKHEKHKRRLQAAILVGKGSIA